MTIAHEYYDNETIIKKNIIKIPLKMFLLNSIIRISFLPYNLKLIDY